MQKTFYFRFHSESPYRYYSQISSYMKLRRRTLTGAHFDRSGKRPPSIQLLRGLSAGTAVGLAGGIVGTFHYDFRYGAALGLTFGLVAGIPVGMIGGLIRWFNEPTSSLPAATPRSTLRDDRTVALVCLLAITVVSAALIGLVGSYFFHLMKSPIVPPLNALYGLRFGLCISLVLASCVITWPSFVLAHFWFGVTGRMPWRMMRFLRDSYVLGVLRQEGAIYQFRNSSVLDQLNEIYVRRHPGRKRQL